MRNQSPKNNNNDIEIAEVFEGRYRHDALRVGRRPNPHMRRLASTTTTGPSAIM